MEIETTIREAFWQAVEEQAQRRGLPITQFNKKIAQTILDAGLVAYQDNLQGLRKHRVVSAPTGSGKSSYAMALLKALINADGSGSGVFLCETIDQCEDTYQELCKLISSNDLAIWTSAHDASKDLDEVEASYGFRPSDQFRVDSLENYRVIVVTHAFYRGSRGHLARVYKDNYRTLTIMDERPQEVTIYDIDQGDVAKARDWIVEKCGSGSDAAKALTDLHRYLGEMWETERKEGVNYRALSQENLDWFSTVAAHELLRESEEATTCRVIGFGQSLATGYAFMSRYEGSLCGGRFVGYKMDLPICAGTILLDATADIDGVAQIAPWRDPVETPKVSFENLTIKHITPPEDIISSREKISQIAKVAKRARPYGEWIKRTIVENTDIGEKVLVVAHKAIIDHEYIPSGDSLGEDAYDLEGRKVACVNWGYGIGSNRWKEATSVFLFGEFHVPKRATVAQVLGILDQPAGSSALSRMQSPNSPFEAFKALQTGHLLRWEKQLAMRGNARNITPEGICGKQKLFVTSEFKRFVKHKEDLFPGSTLIVVEQETMGDKTGPKIKKGSEGLIHLLLTTDRDALTLKDVFDLSGINLSKNGARLLACPEVKAAMVEGSWDYVSGKSRSNPSRFQRTHMATTQEAA